MRAAKKATPIIALFFVLCALPQTTHAFKRVYLTTADVSPWTVPDDWSDVNVISAIGPGGGGRTGGASGSGGGGGGAYSSLDNLAGLSPGDQVSFVVGTGGTPSADGADTWFNGSGTTCSVATMSVCADAGARGTAAATAGLGGVKANNVPANAGASGGNGGAGQTTGDTGGGGGGAGGLYGVGGTGTAGVAATPGAGGGGGGADGGSNAGAASGTTGGAGGNNVFGVGRGTGGTTSVNATAGENGAGGGGGAGSSTGTLYRGANGGDGNIDWTAPEYGVKGSGGGGGGAGGQTTSSTANEVGGDGGQYGGGGGGGETAGGNGGDGLIVITYIPDVPTSARAVRLLGNIRFLGGVRLLLDQMDPYHIVFERGLTDDEPPFHLTS